MDGEQHDAMSRQEIDWSRATDHDAFGALAAVKRRIIVTLSVLFLTAIPCMALLTGYAKPLLRTKVLGAFNLGYLLILLTYVLCWVVSLIYVRYANRNFERLSAAAIAAAETGAAR